MGNTQKKKKHVVRNILLAVLLVLVLLIGGFLLVFGDELRLLYKAVTITPEALESQKAENDKKTHELLEEIAVATMRDLTDEERELLAKGDLSKEEALALIKGETTASVTSSPIEETSHVIETTAAQGDVSPKETVAVTTNDDKKYPEETSVSKEPSTTVAITPVETTAQTKVTVQTTAKTEPPNPDTTKRNRIDEIIAEIYLLRAHYLNQIDELIQNTKKEYVALPKNQRNLQGKMRLIERSLIPKGNALEAECDRKMKVLLDELSTLLKELNMSTAIVGEIEKAYSDQKDLKKTELYNQYSAKLN